MLLTVRNDCLNQGPTNLRRHPSAGEVCREWQTWGDYFHIKSIFGHSLLQATIYVALAVCPLGKFYWLCSSPPELMLGHLCWQCRNTCHDICSLVSFIMRSSSVLKSHCLPHSAFHTGSSFHFVPYACRRANSDILIKFPKLKLCVDDLCTTFVFLILVIDTWRLCLRLFPIAMDPFNQSAGVGPLSRLWFITWEGSA